MKSLYIKEPMAYNGEQLSPLYNYLNHGLMGDSVVAWQGSCDIPLDHMIDGEDVLKNSEIAAHHMLHFIVEVFHQNLHTAVCLQRLLGSIVKDKVEAESSQKLERKGDDLYVGDAKFNISIATSSSNSVLLHFGVNVTNKSTPVKTFSLKEDLGLDAEDFAKKVLEAFTIEWESIKAATTKVRTF